MIIKEISIKNYKSLLNLRITNPESFSVFFGTNAAGKSNIFEVLELVSFYLRKPKEALKYFGSFNDLYSFQSENINEKKIIVEIESYSREKLLCEISERSHEVKTQLGGPSEIKEYFDESFSRIFLNNQKIKKEIYKDDIKLNSDGKNAYKVLKRLLQDPEKREVIIELLQFIIPEFKDIDIKEDSFTGKDELIIYEEYSSKPFTGNLISDGTENAISLITALFQSDNPQFLLIEEPENGLNPKVIKEFVQICRDLVSQKKHIIWLATHSQTLVSELKPSEAILVFKQNGITQIKQFNDFNLHNLKMDEAWLSNVLGGGIPW